MPEVKFGDHTSQHVSEKRKYNHFISWLVTFSLNGNDCNKNDNPNKLIIAKKSK